MEEEGLKWRVSSHSGGGNNCVEVAGKPGEVLIRDTKARSLGHVKVSAKTWVALLDKLRR